jgi:hypothetical protein
LAGALGVTPSVLGVAWMSAWREEITCLGLTTVEAASRQHLVFLGCLAFVGAVAAGLSMRGDGWRWLIAAPMLRGLLSLKYDLEMRDRITGYHEWRSTRATYDLAALDEVKRNLRPARLLLALQAREPRVHFEPEQVRRDEEVGFAHVTIQPREGCCTVGFLLHEPAENDGCVDPDRHRPRTSARTSSTLTVDLRACARIWATTRGRSDSRSCGPKRSRKSFMETMAPTGRPRNVSTTGGPPFSRDRATFSMERRRRTALSSFIPFMRLGVSLPCDLVEPADERRAETRATVPVVPVA